MAIVKTSWEEFLSTDSEIPHDVHFLAITENEDNDSRKLIRAHKVLLAEVSPVFRGMLFGPLKETREVIEVKDTTHEAFNTMIKYITSPLDPGSSLPCMKRKRMDTMRRRKSSTRMQFTVHISSLAFWILPRCTRSSA